MEKEAVQALIVVTDPILYSQRNQILAFAAQERLPAMYPYRGIPEEGGLISYAPSDRDIFRRAASYVDRILKGGQSRRFACRTADQIQRRSALPFRQPCSLPPTK
jgi:ABC-type uncharacterized transport system substrate-binding protein